MSVFADYRKDEQDLLLASLEAVAVVISTASPGRAEETASEGIAAATYVLDSHGAYVGNTLVSSVILELERRIKAGEHFPDYLAVATAPGAAEQAVETVKGALDVLDRRASPDEAAGYRRWLMEIAVKAAEAGKEDQGFLGRGGVLVNDAEREALDRLGGIIGIEPGSVGA